MKNGRHISEFYGVGVMLAISGGFFDAYTFISRDGVFANAQTGNMVLLAINLRNGEWVKSLLYFLPIMSFVIGVFLVEFFKSKFSEHPKIHWHQLVLIFEIAIMTLVGFIPQGKLNTLANILVSFTCAMQVEAFRRMNGNPFATTMCTGNLRSATDNLFQYFKTKNKDKLHNAFQYYGIIFFFICGAAVGALITDLIGTKAIFVSLAGLLAALIILKSDDDKAQMNKV